MTAITDKPTLVLSHAYTPFTIEKKKNLGKTFNIVTVGTPTVHTHAGVTGTTRVWVVSEDNDYGSIYFYEGSNYICTVLVFFVVVKAVEKKDVSIQTQSEVI